MGLTELKQPAKLDFYAGVKNRMSTLYNVMTDLKRLSEDLALMDADTLNVMGVPATGLDEGLRTDLVNLRIMINELIDYFEGTATTQTNVPKTVVNKLRSVK